MFKVAESNRTSVQMADQEADRRTKSLQNIQILGLSQKCGSLKDAYDAV